jgi:hypothetical protein
MTTGAAADGLPSSTEPELRAARTDGSRQTAATAQTHTCARRIASIAASPSLALDCADRRTRRHLLIGREPNAPGTGCAPGETQGGGRRPFACVRVLLRAQSEARPRCDARHAKSGKQVRALLPLQRRRLSTTRVARLATSTSLENAGPTPAFVLGAGIAAGGWRGCLCVRYRQRACWRHHGCSPACRIRWPGDSRLVAGPARSTCFLDCVCRSTG